MLLALDELLGDQGITGLFWIRAESPAATSALIERIDGEFANSDAETITETEHAFQIGFVSLLGNLKLLIGSICTVIVFTLVLVTGGTGFLGACVTRTPKHQGCAKCFQQDIAVSVVRRRAETRDLSR